MNDNKTIDELTKHQSVSKNEADHKNTHILLKSKQFKKKVVSKKKVKGVPFARNDSPHKIGVRSVLVYVKPSQTFRSKSIGVKDHAFKKTKQIKDLKKLGFPLHKKYPVLLSNELPAVEEHKVFLTNQTNREETKLPK